MSDSSIYKLVNKRYLLALSIIFVLLLGHYFSYQWMLEEDSRLQEELITGSRLLDNWSRGSFLLYFWEYKDRVITRQKIERQMSLIDSLCSEPRGDKPGLFSPIKEQSKQLLNSIHHFAGQNFPSEWAFKLQKQNILHKIEGVTATISRHIFNVRYQIEDHKKSAEKLSLILLIAELIFLQLILIFLLRPVARKTDALFKKLEREKEEAVNANNAKSLYLSTMSHEIRTPLNGVLAMTDLLMETDLSFEQRDYLGIIQASGKDLLSVISDILDFSRLESNQLELMEMNFSLKQLLEKVLENFEDEARDKGIQLMYYSEPEVPEYITGDPKRLSQILMNLLSNALKFTRDGEIFIRTSIQSGENDNNEILFAVSDTGMGIPEDRLDSLFQPFKQIRNSIEKRFEGTGLGLALSARLVELMSGSIWVESEINKGSTFYFSIPLRTDGQMASAPPLPAVDEDVSLPEEPLVHTPETTAPEGMQILLAEDNTINQRLMERLMERIGYKLDIARDGREAVEMARKKRYNIIFMDLQMPELDGLQATRRILSEAPENKPFIIAMTANVSQEDRDLCLQAGMVDYIAKPISLEKVKEMISRFEK
ncbi:MAG TPA: response regulator [Caldithrix abyssi]|uniref:histidine kinase n=1 Tax=Caldithrix abyssi TaxID=187145 RepID=A0A7V5RQ34_CALAY|nr:response regulator [Caldithrix abyssi]